MIKTLSKVGIEESYFNIIKAIYDRPTANTTLNGQKLKAFPLRSGTRQRYLLLPLLLTGSPSHSNQTGRRNKRHPNWKERSKTVIIHSDMIVYIESCKDSIKKLLDLINEFDKIAGYKVSIKKLMDFLYTQNELSERETG